ncbi:PREDICTED: serpin B13 [Hipposideros armiger]|uniref:Serpin B13 n=1 Tax=Hipposideros armiger TaxID=186990 RepID=A0A8B7SMJ9_HIPAR|nr:PREDICTED: serpin B13 [Hipposideros armiger]
MNSLGTATTQFGFDLFKELNKTKDGNIFFSPVSITTAIGMLPLGTRGATATQLQEVLFSEKDTGSSRIIAEGNEVMEKREEIHHQFQTFLSEISKPNNNYELKIANRLFGEKTYLFLHKYLDYVEKHYHASLEPVDFVNAADESRKKINSWVESQTHGRTKQVSQIIDGISPEKLVEWTNPEHMEERTVNLRLPRLEVEDSYNLEAILPAMGLGAAFSEHEAAYSGMSPLSGLHAQQFLHRSFMVANEEGTEAAAATGVGFVVTSEAGHEAFHCNHPFLFFIRHNGSSSILFFGRFSSP